MHPAAERRYDAAIVPIRPPAPRQSEQLPSGSAVSMLPMLLLVAILLPLALFALGAWQVHERLYRDAEELAGRQAASLHEHAQNVLQTQDLVIQQALQLTRGMGWEEISRSRALFEALTKLIADAPQVDAIFLLDRDGQVRLSTRAFPTPAGDFADRDYFQAQRDGWSGPFLSGSYMGRVSQHPIFNLALRRNDARGDFDGVIGVSASIRYFERFYASLATPAQNARIALIRKDGELLVSYPGAAAPDRSWVSSFVAELPPAESGVYHRGSSEPRLLAFKRLREYPALVAFSIDMAAVRAAAYSSLLPWAVLSGTAALLLSLAAVALNRRIRRESDAIRRAERSHAELIAETEQRGRAEAALLHARKVEAMGQLTSGVAHDFTNLLRAIGANLDLLEARAADRASRELLQRCRRSIVSGSSLVQKLLEFARPSPTGNERVDLNERILGAQPLLVHTAPGFWLDTQLAEGLWPVECDGSQIDLALMNLVSNARDAAPPDHKITITTANLVLAGEAGLTGAFVALSVIDGGCGIPAELLGRVWEPFFTTKPTGQGTGLGLAMVASFARQAGGGVNIASGAGATQVTIYLPRAAAAADAAAKTEDGGDEARILRFPQAR